MDLRVILVRFMADKEAHKKIPRLEGRAQQFGTKVDRMYKYKQKGNEDQDTTNTNNMAEVSDIVNAPQLS